MKLINLSLLLLVALTVSPSIAAQTDVGLNQVTLYWFSPGHCDTLLANDLCRNLKSALIDTEKTDHSRSSVNFETGKRGGDSGGFDLRYGGMVIGTPTKHGDASRFLTDWLGVLDCRSMIVDLGAKQWQDFKETPPFPKPKTSEPPRPLSKPGCVVNTSAGRTEFSPYRQFVEVNPGHVYLMRFLRGNKVRYVMFRVESFAQRDNCVLSWKLVRPPNVADNESF